MHTMKRIICLFGLAVLASCSRPSVSDNPVGGTASANGTLVVSWRPPTENTDGTPLTDLAGYTVYYGTQPGVYTNTVAIDDPSATHFVLRGLRPGTHYFVAISATNTKGGHSVLSSEAHDASRSK
jgi:hypothetical protein